MSKFKLKENLFLERLIIPILEENPEEKIFFVKKRISSEPYYNLEFRTESSKMEYFLPLIMYMEEFGDKPFSEMEDNKEYSMEELNLSRIELYGKPPKESISIAETKYLKNAFFPFLEYATEITAEAGRFGLNQLHSFKGVLYYAELYNDCPDVKCFQYKLPAFSYSYFNEKALKEIGAIDNYKMAVLGILNEYNLKIGEKFSIAGVDDYDGYPYIYYFDEEYQLNQAIVIDEKNPRYQPDPEINYYFLQLLKGNQDIKKISESDNLEYNENPDWDQLDLDF